jgi:hypothetical protein
MNQSVLQFKIAQLRQDKAIATFEAIAAVCVALFGYVFLPQLLFQFVYANQKLTEEPALLKNLPSGIFAVGLLYVLYVVICNVMRTMQVAKLEKKLDEASVLGMNACCQGCGDSCSCDEHGNCQCGCEVMTPVSSPSTTAKMAEKMAKVNSKKKSNKKK